MAVSVWAIILSVGVGLIALGILAKYTGVGDIFSLIIDFVGHIFSAARDFFSQIVSTAPPILKFIIFIVLFALVFPFVMNYTLGLNYVCDGGGNLYYGDIPSVIAYEGLVGITDVQGYDVVESEVSESNFATDSSLVTGDPYGLDPGLYKTGEQYIVIPVTTYMPSSGDWLSSEAYVESKISDLVANPTNWLGMVNKEQFVICYDKKIEACAYVLGERGCFAPWTSLFKVNVWYSKDRDKIYHEVTWDMGSVGTSVYEFFGVDRSFSMCKRNDTAALDRKLPIGMGYWTDPIEIWREVPDDGRIDKGWLYNAYYISSSYTTRQGTGFLGSPKVYYSAGGSNVEQRKANSLYTADNLLEDNFDLVDMSNQSGIITRSCSPSELGEDIEFREDIGLFGIPVFKKEFIWLIAFLTILLALVKLGKGRH